MNNFKIYFKNHFILSFLELNYFIAPVCFKFFKSKILSFRFSLADSGFMLFCFFFNKVFWPVVVCAPRILYFAVASLAWRTGAKCFENVRIELSILNLLVWGYSGLDSLQRSFSNEFILRVGLISFSKPRLVSQLPNLAVSSAF